MMKGQLSLHEIWTAYERGNKGTGGRCGDLTGFTVDFKDGIWWLCCKFNSKRDIKVLYSFKPKK